MRTYRFLDVNVAVSGTDAVLDALHARLRYFPPAPGVPEVRFDFVTLEAGEPHVPRPAGRSRPLASHAGPVFQVDYFPADDELYLSVGDRVRARCSCAEGRVEVSIAQPEAEHLWLAAHPVFVVPFFEMLKRRGYFNLHAAGVSVGDTSLLFAGHSTAGKSTLAVALCRAGFDFLSDDYVFLSRRDDDLDVLGFPEELDLLDGTIALFPELRPLLDVAMRPGWVKRQVRVEEYWTAPRTSRSAPGVLVFPSVADSPTSAIEPMTPRDAIADLVPNIQFTNAALAQAHLDVITDLVRRCGCYRLKTGRDLDTLPARLRDLVEAHRAR